MNPLSFWLRAAAVLAAFVVAASIFVLHPSSAKAQVKIVWTDKEQPIYDQLRGLRGLSDEQRATVTKQLALQIRALPAGDHKMKLAFALASLSTEGDFGRDTLQEATTTLERALKEFPLPPSPEDPRPEYVELAALVRYEHMQASLDDPQFAAAKAKLEAEDQRHQQTDFTLEDLNGKKWTLKELRGKVVLINFWATWCPPCRKEMPSLDKLYSRFRKQDFVVLAISDEDAGKVKPFVARINVSFPILLDPGRKVNRLFEIEGIPKSFVYDRQGKLVAQAIDMRTEKQFLEMLSAAGIQ